MRDNSVLQQMLVGGLVGTAIASLIGSWKISNILKERILMAMIRKKEFDSIDADMLVRGLVAIVLLLVLWIPLGFIISQLD